MKGKVKKNQLIIVALAVMIAAAGYLNYTGRLFGENAKGFSHGSWTFRRIRWQAFSNSGYSEPAAATTSITR